MNSPTTQQIIDARHAAGLSQPAAAALVYTPMRTWQDWEYGKSSMHPAIFELFSIKTKNNLD